MLALVLVPAEVWHRSDAAGTYTGFDPNLIYVQEMGDNASRSGQVEISSDRIQIVSAPGSQPAVHLLTTPSGFTAETDLLVREGGVEGQPLKIGIWEPRTGSGFWLIFGSAPTYEVTAETLNQRAVIHSQQIGNYTPGIPQHLELKFDNLGESIEARLTTDIQSPSGGQMLRHPAGAPSPGYDHHYIVSEPVPVQGQAEYTQAAVIRLLTDPERYNFVVGWYDQEGRFLDYSGRNQTAQPLEGGWLEVIGHSVAPSNATSARIFLGSRGGTLLLYDTVSLMAADFPRNLLRNGDFEEGPAGWTDLNNRTTAVGIVDPARSLLVAGTTGSEAPAIFGDLRRTLSAISDGGDQVASVDLQNFALTLPAQGRVALTINDGRAHALTLLLMIAGIVWSLGALGIWGYRQTRASWGALRSPRPIVGPPLGLLTVGIGLCSAVVVANVLMFSLGSYLFDTASEVTWSYMASRQNPAELYRLASTVGLDRYWNGLPVFDASFPYEPLMVYFFAFVGWTDRLLFGGFHPAVLDSHRMEFMIKSVGLLFAFGCSALIYLILRTTHVSQRGAWIAAALFMFNPALWFNVSIWGETETFSLFFVLLSIWMAERGSPLGAWLSLGVAVLTRPQMGIPALLLGCVYFRKFSVLQNLRAMSGSVIGLFVMLSPFLLALSPSLPVDVLRVNFALRVTPEAAGYVEPRVAADGYSFWPLLTGIFEDQSGPLRFSFASTTELLAGLTYAEWSGILSIGIPVSLALFLLVRGKTFQAEGAYLPVVATGMLGWLMFTTSSSSHYFLYCIALLIVSWKYLGRLAYVGTVVLSTTAFVTQYGSLGRHIRNVPDLMPMLHSSNNAATRLAIDLYLADWFITVGIIANMAVLFWLSIVAFRPSLPARRARPLPEPKRAADGWAMAQPQDL